MHVNNFKNNFLLLKVIKLNIVSKSKANPKGFELLLYT